MDRIPCKHVKGLWVSTPATKFPVHLHFKVPTILVPIAHSFLLAGLARENGGLWGHDIGFLN